MSTDATMQDSNNSNDDDTIDISVAKVQQMLQACQDGDFTTVLHLIQNEHVLYARIQDDTTGTSPLMVAASTGNLPLVQLLCEQGGSPWNALDRQGLCAGDVATNNQHWHVVNYLVEWATRAELVLGMVGRNDLNSKIQGSDTSTKPDYLQQRLQYTDSALVDQDKDAVMMAWETPLMKAHAQVLLQHLDSLANFTIINVGFGMGIIDTAIQEGLQDRTTTSKHIIIEAHSDVYQQMCKDGWDKKPNVQICFGKWQDVMPQLVQQNVQADAIFFDTYGEHYMDLEDFHLIMSKVLTKPHGIYSFFNGLAPDNLFFHGVACQCVKLQLSQLGLDSDFMACEITINSNDDKVWEGIRRKYWHGRDTYYLPRCTWNAEYLSTGKLVEDPILADARKNKATIAPMLEQDNLKRQKKV